MMFMGSATPTRAVILVRISQDRADEREGVDRQLADCRQLATRLGWTVSREVVENDRSAYKRKQVRLPDGSTALRTDRPDFREVVNGLADGTYDGLLCYHADRVVRDPRDCEDLIDSVEQHHPRPPVESVTGSLRLATDTDILAARIAVAVANQSSRDTARRVARKHEQLATEGKPAGGGLRAWGYSATWQIIPEERDAIREVHRRVVTDGHSLAEIVRDFNARGLKPVMGGLWNTTTLKGACTKPAVAGQRVYRGAVVGPATWDEILTPTQLAELTAELANRQDARGANAGGSSTLIWWLRGVLHCGKCDQPLIRWGKASDPAYRCVRAKGGCGGASIKALPTQETVSGAIVTLLTRPETLDRLHALLSAPVLSTEAQQEIAEDEAQLKELALMWARREMGLPEYRAARDVIEERLTHRRVEASRHAPRALRSLLDADDIAAKWNGLEPADKKAVTLAIYPDGLTVRPAGPSAPRRFDPNRIIPRKPQESRDPQ